MSDPTNPNVFKTAWQRIKFITITIGTLGARLTIATCHCKSSHSWYLQHSIIYAKRVRTGEAEYLAFEQSAAIEYFEKAIEGIRAIGNDYNQENPEEF